MKLRGFLLAGIIGILFSCNRNSYDPTASVDARYKGSYAGKKQRDLPGELEQETTHPYVGGGYGYQRDNKRKNRQG